MSSIIKELTENTVRIDKWLWSVRICKTRSAATDLCKRQRVSIDGQNVKPSRSVRIGQIVTVRRDGVDWVYKVLQCIEKRVGAPEAAKCREDLTPKETLDKLEQIRTMVVPRRDKGEGRPTKKDRRAMDRLYSEEE